MNAAAGPGAVRAGLALFSGFFVVGLTDMLLLFLGPAASAEGLGQLSRFVPLTLIAAPAAAGLAGFALALSTGAMAARGRRRTAAGVVDLLSASPLVACIPGLLSGPAISGSCWRWPLGLAAAAAAVAGVGLLRRGAVLAVGRALGGGPGSRAIRPAALVALAAGLGAGYLAAGSVASSLYPDFHRAVSLATAAFASAVLHVVFVAASNPPSSRRLVAVLASCLVLGWAGGARLSRQAVLGRQLIADHGLFLAPFAGALYTAGRALAFETPWASPKAAPDALVKRAGISQAAFLAEGPRRDVLLITVDALRGDAIGRDSPLAEGALFFERAYSPSNYTPFSMPGLVLGYQPPPGSDPPARHALAEAFNRGGYLTELHFTAHEYASLERTALWPLASRGFLFGRYRPEYLDAAAVLAQVERTLTLERKPRFVWAHLSDVHAPFLLARGAVRSGADCPATYAGQLRCLLGVLEPWMKRVVAADPDLVWALSSDHGESLGERGVMYHGSNLFDEQVRVPLLLGGPGVEAGVHPHPVGNMRLGATLLDLAGAALPAKAVLLPRSPADRPSEPGVLLVCRRERCGVVLDGYKLVASPREGAVALYDLHSDPGETTNLVVREQKRARRMLAELPGLGCPFDLSALFEAFDPAASGEQGR